MKVRITKGTGKGSTNLSAFDAALIDAGIGNYNLIKLSSIIPPSSEIVKEKINPEESEYGDRLYCVLSKSLEKDTGEEAWAGLGWSRESSGRGIILEGSASSEEKLIKSIKDSFRSIKENRSEDFHELEVETKGIECEGEVVCAVVIAVYGSEDWC